MIEEIYEVFFLLRGGNFTLDPPADYSPSLDFSDARNSQYCSLWG